MTYYLAEVGLGASGSLVIHARLGSFERMLVIYAGLSSFERMLEDCQALRPTVFSATPAFWAAVLRDFDAEVNDAIRNQVDCAADRVLTSLRYAHAARARARTHIG